MAILKQDGSGGRRIVLLGPPGAGKGTHGEKLAALWDVPHIATGDILRRIIDEAGAGPGAGGDTTTAATMTTGDAELARQVRVIEKGQLIPDSLMNAILFAQLARSDARNGWILDGYPRTLPQAHALDAYLAEDGRVPLRVALALDVREETVLDRLSARLTCPNCGATYHLRNEPPRVMGICDRCGHTLAVREDDKPDHVRVRLRLYHERTEPLLRYYEESGRLRRVPTDEGETAAFARIVDVLANL